LLRFEPLSREHDGLVDVLQVGGTAESGLFLLCDELGDDVHTGQRLIPTFMCRARSRTIWRAPAAAHCECIRLGRPSRPPWVFCTGAG